jgi:RAD3-like DEAD/DEAH box helicase
MTGPRARAALANAEDRSPTRILSSQGPLTDHIEGFSARLEQQEMAEIVAETIEARGVLLCEAGTGTGKTFAYLVPSLLSGRKVIISTGTRALQTSSSIVICPWSSGRSRCVDAALFKGRGNYLCRYRLGRNAAHGYGDRLAAQLAHVSAWAGRTSSGDIGELGLPDESPLYPFITSTSDNCLGQGCPEVQACHVVRARREAQAAEVVVVNHHLLLADLTLREEGFAELLPGADAVIVDEAHQLPEVAQFFFSTSLGSRQLLELCRDTVAAERDEAGDLEGLRRAAVALKQATGDFAHALGATPPPRGLVRDRRTTKSRCRAHDAQPSACRSGHGARGRRLPWRCAQTLPAAGAGPLRAPRGGDRRGWRSRWALLVRIARARLHPHLDTRAHRGGLHLPASGRRLCLGVHLGHPRGRKRFRLFPGTTCAREGPDRPLGEPL